MFPVEKVMSEISRALADNRNVVLTAPPGSGKTTCVPAGLIDSDWLAGKKILMLEPRRIAARSSAGFIASKFNEPVGEKVGYQVRLERKVSPRTRLEIITEGLLTRRLLQDPELSDVGLVIFDEFHERSLQCDVALALALETKKAFREDLRLMVMSATLDADEVARHLGNAKVIHAQGRMFPVEIEYLGDVALAPAVKKALAETPGDVLCFLPGEGEIRRAMESLDGLDQADVLPLYGSLPREGQDRIFEKSSRRKVILSTSIAETSLTIEGVSAVIDSGLMRVPRFSPSTGMTGLVTLPLTRDRAEQRRGRAGRVSRGVCYRLWSESADAARAERMTPEILESELSSTVLTSVAWGARRRDDLPWLTPPPVSAWNRAEELLRILGAFDENGALTDKGRKMSELSMHPRLANMLIGGGDPMLAAIIEDGVKGRETDIRYVQKSERKHKLARRFQREMGFPKTRESALGSEGAMLALAYPDRIAKNRGNGTFRMVNGRGAFLDSDDPLSKEPYLVCCELDDRVGDAKIFLAAKISEREILDLFGDKITEKSECSWDRRTDSVKSLLKGQLGSMTVYEKPRQSAEGTEEALMQGVRQKGVDNLPCWTEGSLQFRKRIAFLHRQLSGSAASWPDIGDESVIAALKNFVSGMIRWRDLEKVDMFKVLESILAVGGLSRQEVDRLAPARISLANGRSAPVSYDGLEPTLEAKLQDCFGMMKSPMIVNGKVPVVMTLLSPARRPIQITKDLAGFWRGAYQLVRKDMRGRYPKHQWPENPVSGEM